MDSAGSPGPCDLAPEGYYSTGTGVKISCGSTKWSAAGATLSTQCFDCPAGYVCAGTTKVDCGAGNFCAVGSSATSPCTAGQLQVHHHAHLLIQVITQHNLQH
jgi:hypothetical protein